MFGKAKLILNINMIFVEPLPLKFIHLEHIDTDVNSNEVPLDVFSLKEALE